MAVVRSYTKNLPYKGVRSQSKYVTELLSAGEEYPCTGSTKRTITMVIRGQLLLWLFVLCVGVVIAQVPSDLKLTLYHQLVHSEFAKDISPRGVISYDTSRNTARLTEQSEVIDFASVKGIYRIGVYDSNKKQLGPAAFTKLVPCKRESC